MNAMRIITAVLTLVVTGIFTNTASAQYLMCHSAIEYDYYVTCGTCAPCPVTPSMADQAFYAADKATTAVTNLAGQLARANGALTSLRRSKADASVVASLESRVTQLEGEMQSSCASVKEIASAQKCWEIFGQATGGTQIAGLGVINNALQAGTPFEGTIAIGKSAFTPGGYIHFKTPTDAGIPAFANVRRDRVAPASEYDSGNSLWPYFVVPATTTLAGLAIGYGYGDDSRTITDAGGGTSFREGNKAETSLIGGGIGLASGLVFDAAYYLLTRPDAR